MKEKLIEFEKLIGKLWEAGRLPYLIHFSGGNEDQLIEIFKDIKPTDWVFSTHRAHYHYLLHGGDEKQLLSDIMDGKSMFLFKERFITSSIVGGNAAMAVGVAYSNMIKGSQDHVYCFVGDAAAQTGHFLEAALFAKAEQLPITFIVESNQFSVNAPIKSDLKVIDELGVDYYSYIRTYPHAGNGAIDGSIIFKDV